MRKLMIGLAVLVLIGATTNAAEYRPCSAQERSFYGATHVVVLDHDDLTTATTNTAQTLTNVLTVAAGEAVQFVVGVLDEDFDSQNIYYTNTTSTLLEIGDGSDTDLFASSTELASDGTEVDVILPRTAETAITTTTGAIEGTNYVKTATVATTVYGRKLYTSAGFVAFQFTPNAEEALSWLSKGKIRLYFKRFDEP